MRGASRPSFADLREQLSQAATSAASGKLTGDELFAVTGLLDTEHGLRRALSDPGKPGAEKAVVARSLLSARISPATMKLVETAVEGRWASPGDLTDALEQAAIEAESIAAEYGGALDDLEDDLFRFGRLVAATPDLRTALASPNLPAENKKNLLAALLAGKASQTAIDLITQVVIHPRGRSLTASLDLCARIAADRRQRLIATVRTSAELTAAQRRRLADALRNAYGHDIQLNLVVDPAVVGGISIQIGDELIDGTAATRLAEVRRNLAA